MDTLDFKRLLTVAFLPVILSACSSEGDTEDSPLVGTWITEACGQMSDDSGNQLDAWSRGLFEFSGDGRLLLGFREYGDSNCQTLTRTQAPADQGLDLRFADLGETTLPDGLEGRRLRITEGSFPPSFSSEGTYLIMQRQACFSYAFRFRPTGIGFSSDSADINYLDCLQRI